MGTIAAPTIGYALLLPFIVIFAAACVGILLEAVVPRDLRRAAQLLLAFVAVGVALVVTISNWSAGGDVVVLGLPRGGVPVAYQVARALAAPLDVIVVRKVGVPQHAELAMGAVGEDGATVINSDVVRAMHVDQAELHAAQDRERVEVQRRVRTLRAQRPRVPLRGRAAAVCRRSVGGPAAPGRGAGGPGDRRGPRPAASRRRRPGRRRRPRPRRAAAASCCPAAGLG